MTSTSFIIEPSSIGSERRDRAGRRALAWHQWILVSWGVARKKNTPTKTLQGTGRRQLVPGTDLTRLQLDFLKAFVETGGKVPNAAQLAGMAKSTHYHWLRISRPYALAYEKVVTEAKLIREDIVRAAIREAWEVGWDEETIEQKLEQRPDPKNAKGAPIMVPVEVRRKQTKRRFPSALFYEANSLWGNPARLEINTVGATQISIEGLRDLVESAESVKRAEASGNPDD